MYMSCMWCGLVLCNKVDYLMHSSLPVLVSHIIGYSISLHAWLTWHIGSALGMYNGSVPGV